MVHCNTFNQGRRTGVCLLRIQHASSLRCRVYSSAVLSLINIVVVSHGWHRFSVYKVKLWRETDSIAFRLDRKMNSRSWITFCLLDYWYVPRESDYSMPSKIGRSPTPRIFCWPEGTWTLFPWPCPSWPALCPPSLYLGPLRRCTTTRRYIGG